MVNYFAFQTCIVGISNAYLYEMLATILVTTVSSVSRKSFLVILKEGYHFLQRGTWVLLWNLIKNIDRILVWKAENISSSSPTMSFHAVPMVLFNLS